MQHSPVIDPVSWKGLNPPLTLTPAGDSGAAPVLPMTPKRHDAQRKTRLINGDICNSTALFRRKPSISSGTGSCGCASTTVPYGYSKA